jgi:hypothetical protein
MCKSPVDKINVGEGDGILEASGIGVEVEVCAVIVEVMPVTEIVDSEAA